MSFKFLFKKNIGYLVSIQNGNETIIETDDDNYPKNNFLKFLDLKHEVNEIRRSDGQMFIKKNLQKNLNIWPRGLPLNKIENCPTFKK